MEPLGICGNDCNQCYIYLANRSEDREQLKNVVMELKQIGWLDETVEHETVFCNGCRSHEKCEYEVRKCALAKNIINCGWCKDYPCNKTSKMFVKIEKNAKTCKKFLSSELYKQFQQAFPSE